MAIPRVYFSYVAYAKNLILYLCSLTIPVDSGLSESEFSTVESSLGFSFPSDLLAILQEGLPIGPGFIDWRSSSKHHLKIMTGLPVSGIREKVSGGFWAKCWGERPDETDRAMERVDGLLKRAPVLIPVYRDFYIPLAPCAAGNPVFCVRGGDVRIRSFDITRFFRSFGIWEGRPGELGERRDGRAAVHLDDAGLPTGVEEGFVMGSGTMCCRQIQTMMLDGNGEGRSRAENFSVIFFTTFAIVYSRRFM